MSVAAPTASAPLRVSSSPQGLAWKAFAALFVLELALVALDYALAYADWLGSGPTQALFNVAREDSLHNFVASLENLLVAATLWLLVAHARGNGSRRVVAGWSVLAAAFTYLGVDDGVHIHERVGTALGDTPALSFFPSYAWQVVFVPLFAAAAVTAAVTLRRELTGRRLAAVAAALYCYAVATLLDHLEGREAYERLAADWGLGEYTVTHYGRVLEEGIETFGTLVVLAVFLEHLAVRAGEIRIVFRSG